MSSKDSEAARAYNKAYYEAHKNELKQRARIRAPIWQKANPERRSASIRARRPLIRESRLRIEQRARQKLKREVIEVLGGACKCCGETELDFLCIDHVQNDGAVHRKVLTQGSCVLHRAVRAAGYPSDLYQVLCHNCNWSKRIGDGCCVHHRPSSWSAPPMTTTKKAKRKMREEALQKLGGACKCCGETEYEFLSIDHVFGGGNAHRACVGRNISQFLRNNNYPPGFQVLCLNCNRSKHFGSGACAHQDPVSRTVYVECGLVVRKP